MRKLAGSLCILGAAVWGLWTQRREARRQSLLRAELLSALRRMAEAVRLARTPLPDLLHHASQRCETAEGADFFRAAACAAAAGEDLTARWEEGAMALSLTEEERRALAELGRSFGGDEDQLCRAAVVAEAVLERCGEERRACRTAEEKRAAALWLTAGALAVILLI